MEENPLDLEQHEQETLWDVWKRRLMFVLLIVLCIAFAAPTFGACENAVGSGAEIFATYRVGGEQREMSRIEFDAIWTRLDATSRLLLREAQERRNMQMAVPIPQSPDDVWVHILQNAAAEHAGIHIPTATIDRAVGSMLVFQDDGVFDDGKYRRQLAAMSRTPISHRSFQITLAEILRVAEYRSIFQSAYALMPSQRAFDAWQEDNVKLSVSYVVQPFDTISDEVAAADPADDTLRTFARLPDAERKLGLPARKNVETAFLRVRDIDDTRLIEFENFLKDQGELTEKPDQLGVVEYHANKNDIFTRENWLRLAREQYALATAVYETRLKAWEDGGKVEGESPGDPPPDPTLQTPPADFIGNYHEFWRERILKEVYARMFLEWFAKKAEREGRTFADLAGEHEVLGVRVIHNDEAIADGAFRDEYPEGLGTDSEMDAVVRQYLAGPKPGQTFVAQVHTQGVPTTMLGKDLDARGYMVVRLDGFEPARVRTLDEARDEIVEMWREHEVRVRAKSRLEALRDRVTSGDADLATAATESGLTVRELQRFNRNTAERRPPVALPGEELDEAAQRAADEIKHRNRMVRDYELLSTLEAGGFRKPVLLDDRTDAAYLIRLDESYLPGPEEIRPEQLRAQRFRLLQDTAMTRVGLDDIEALKARYSLEIDEPDKDADPDETDETAGSGDGS